MRKDPKYDNLIDTFISENNITTILDLNKLIIKIKSKFKK